ncbi:DUF4843 domain-containing protein [Pedobacter sp. ASV28]|uniref:DUF4843 domain-containing protein n=1 Tax=Pedobacter sp. ASV28 TaxID=2795123 RepID=UPI0018EDE45D|nr:DUF4843 domain-containing protein [Pedobacter sp. ASV28]
MYNRNKLSITLIVATLVLATWSCKKKDLTLYDETANGSSVYFKEAINAKTQLIKTISFGYEGYSVKDSIVAIPVAVTGYPSNQDRPFKLKLTDATTAIANHHYAFLREPVIRAGRVVDTLLLKINRTADMTTTQFAIDLLLEENETFTTRLVDPTKIYLKYTVLVDDIAGISHLWTTSVRATAVLSYFGTYSRKKVDLMLEVLKLDPAFFYDTSATAPTVTQVLSYSRYMFYWLNKEAAEGRIYLDEKGEVIKMGQYAG